MFTQIIRCFLIIVCISFHTSIVAQDSVYSFRFRNDVTITIDRPSSFQKKKNTQIIFFALPNGNTTRQTMGKLLKEGDDWHYDIQHIKAQTKFIRERSDENIVVVYLENDLRAWPQWKRNHPDHRLQIQAITDTILQHLNIKKFSLHLNGHSGGGSFIFGYLDGKESVPSYVRRITFIDSNYGYDSSFTQKLRIWLRSDKQNHLTVFAYNDSVALYNGKPVVSATGGTWYRSKLMMKDLEPNLNFSCKEDTIIHCASADKRTNVYLKQNPDRKIFHTQQVELNGFIHSVFIGTKNDQREYNYFGARAYTNYIE
jgi:pimeloyl-ACP methyl ester carboxylesterase